MHRLFAFLFLFSLPLLSLADEDAEYRADFEATTVTKVGALAPSFIGVDSSGAAWNFADQKGKVVVLNFFATWCGPCMKEIPHLEKELWGTLKDKGVVLVSIGREHSVSEVAAFKEKARLSYPVLADPERKIYGLYATKYIPRSVLIGRDGKVVSIIDVYAPNTFRDFLAEVARQLARK